ncbi:uncharacterized protein LOC122501819 [Leptopilina heterotoma]|uniref:uncharacterized protein LOC122501819 n=1 Tax=Leptopilina heterotoma TaxID=63436 RepID=UPI001CA9B2CE|nr:uncharacterized protein LOC122501819 [Leptopilina heterotoma]XP_043467517.1 uncharacterized protein LOC122501819 [Leptopilina heterotoma]
MVKNGALEFSKSKEVEFSRFKKRPEEMVRRLLIELVGREELKSMTALGFGRKGKTGKAVPEQIRNAVYNYVKDKAKGFLYEKFVDTINNQCCTLRNPKKQKDDEKEKKIRKGNKNDQGNDKQKNKTDLSDDEEYELRNPEINDHKDNDSQSQDEEDISEPDSDSKSTVAKKRKVEDI